MELQSISRISKEDYYSYFRFVNFKSNTWAKFLLPASILVIIAGTAEIFAIVNYGYDTDQSVIPLLALLVLLMVFMFAYMWFIMPLIGYKLSAKLYSIDNYFTWYNDHFIVKVDSQGVSSLSNYTYEGLLKACEYRGFLYLYVTKNQAHLIPKDSFTKGNWDELKTALINKLGDRYKIYH